MLNYWWVSRPKRKLNSVPDVLSLFAEISLNQEWIGMRGTHLSVEQALEQAGLKRIGERRDQTGGGARTYKAWLVSLGLIFTQGNSRRIKMTLAGEAILEGKSPVAILKNQIFKYQFPSSFSLSRGVDVSPRFKIRPFRFLLKLLNDPDIGYLTEEEIAKIIAVEAESESEQCYKQICERIHEFRIKGDNCLEKDFIAKYRTSKSNTVTGNPFGHLFDLANTITNWLEYTQLIYRESKVLKLLDEKRDEVKEILSADPPFIDRPEQHEFFQRKFGLDPWHAKDNRNLNYSITITAKMIAEQRIRQAYIAESLVSPITRITSSLVDKIADQSGIDIKETEETLYKLYPYGSIGSFMTRYFEMAFQGKEQATDFELATVELFEKVFKFEALHVGSIGLTPDVLLFSNDEGYLGIIDNKAYSRYSITNDHYNRMVYNYIGNISKYSKYRVGLSFFSYISGGFGANIDSQIQSIALQTAVNGSAMSVSNMIKLVEKYQEGTCNHSNIRKILSVNRQVLLTDIEDY